MTPLEALQATLAAEHAAVYVYGLLGGRISRAAEPGLARDLASAYAVHRARRDQLLGLVGDLGVQPVAAEVAYEPATRARTADQCREAAVVLEEGCAATYATAVGSTAVAYRQWAIDALEDAAVRLLGFGGEPGPFPGLVEL